jgi:hypothetical protein
MKEAKRRKVGRKARKEEGRDGGRRNKEGRK